MSWLSEAFGGGRSNPANAAIPFIQQIPGQTSRYYDPYIQAGSRSIPSLEEQYNQLLTNPGDKINQVGQNFQQSPGFKFALDQALQGAGHAAAAGGMAGSPQHEFQNMGIATQLANQDYYNYLNQALGLYGKGLSGEQGLYAGGLGASQSMADQIAQALAQQAAYQYQGQAGQNAAKSGFLSDILGLGSKIASHFL
jgi:hypothetical protein